MPTIVARSHAQSVVSSFPARLFDVVTTRSAQNSRVSWTVTYEGVSKEIV
jgi:hypothetical protein